MEEMNKTADYKQGYRDAIQAAAIELLNKGEAIEKLLYTDEAQAIVSMSEGQRFGKLADIRTILLRKVRQYYINAGMINDMKESI